DSNNWAPTAPVKIGDNVWLGAGSTVLKGVAIGDNAAVGAMSLVTRDVEADSLYAGNPAKFIKKI
ncbi:MAG: acyltransferase, partial [Agathobacter sp.]